MRIAGAALLLSTMCVAAAFASSAPADKVMAEQVPMAITQPIPQLSTSVTLDLGASTLPEPGWMMLVGSGLIALASIVRRSTSA